LLRVRNILFRLTQMTQILLKRRPVRLLPPKTLLGAFNIVRALLNAGEQIIGQGDTAVIAEGIGLKGLDDFLGLVVERSWEIMSSILDPKGDLMIGRLDKEGFWRD
jgi:hypothetical protein